MNAWATWCRASKRHWCCNAPSPSARWRWASRLRTPGEHAVTTFRSAHSFTAACERPDRAAARHCCGWWSTLALTSGACALGGRQPTRRIVAAHGGQAVPIYSVSCPRRWQQIRRPLAPIQRRPGPRGCSRPLQKLRRHCSLLPCQGRAWDCRCYRDYRSGAPTNRQDGARRSAGLVRAPRRAHWTLLFPTASGHETHQGQGRKLSQHRRFQ